MCSPSLVTLTDTAAVAVSQGSVAHQADGIENHLVDVDVVLKDIEDEQPRCILV